jgi:hypothetical protein
MFKDNHYCVERGLSKNVRCGLGIKWASPLFSFDDEESEVGLLR